MPRPKQQAKCPFGRVLQEIMAARNIPTISELALRIKHAGYGRGMYQSVLSGWFSGSSKPKNPLPGVSSSRPRPVRLPPGSAEVLERWRGEDAQQGDHPPPSALGQLFAAVGGDRIVSRYHPPGCRRRGPASWG